jgi:hypothetical protein
MKAGRYRVRRLAMNNILVSERQPAYPLWHVAVRVANARSPSGRAGDPVMDTHSHHARGIAAYCQS